METKRKNNKFFSQHIMINSSSLNEKNVTKDVRNPFRLNKLKKKQMTLQ